MKKLLIANRSEIALRVIRTAREMGIATVAVYSEADRNSPYVAQADEAYRLSGDTYNETYLNQGLIIDICRRSGADAIHPGYGFLSESSEFAAKVLDAGIVWVGPKPEALDELGDKITARRFAERAQVPPVPGVSEPVDNIHTLLDFAQSYDYPVMMKRTDGGGGHGITVVKNDDELRSFFMAHDSLQGADLSSYFIEKYVDRARHVETQCGRDCAGNFTVYSTRDCSVQRRNQKLIEEAPAPFLTEKIEQRLYTYSRRLFDSAEYVGLGTCEFMVTPTSDVYFLEVNPRLQVEHTVTEEVSGIDLVREQLTIASGGILTTAPASRGHSFEFRITSEDPSKNLTPGSGTIEKLEFPTGPGVRVDFGVAQGDTISPKFDSMMGKLIVTAQDRNTAIARSLRVLKDFVIEGIPTPVSLYEVILKDPDFAASYGRFGVTTKWLEKKYLSAQAQSAGAGQPASLSASRFSSTSSVSSSSSSSSSFDNSSHETRSFTVEVNDKRVQVNVPLDLLGALGSSRRLATNRRTQPLRGTGMNHAGEDQKQGPAVGNNGEIVAPMQAVVTRISVASGQKVGKGDLLVVLESMKMENYVYSPIAGTVDKILVGPSDGVDAGDCILTISADGKPNESVENPKESETSEQLKGNK